MKKCILVAVLFLLIPTFLLAQYTIDGRRIYPNTIDSTKFTKDRSSVLGPAVVGGVQMVDATFGELWIPVDWDSITTSAGDNPDKVRGSGAWSLSASTNTPVTGYFPAAGTGNFPIKVFGFEADGSGTDDTVAVRFVCPDNYKDDTMELYLYWFHLDDDAAMNDTVSWAGSIKPVNNASIDSTTSIFAAGTSITRVQTPMKYTGPGSSATTDSLLYITNLDPEVTNLDDGDLITVYIWCDVDRSHLDSGEEVYLIGVLIRWDILDVP